MAVNSVNKTYDIEKNELKCKLKAAINADYLKYEYDKKLNQVLKTVKIPGFRSGKVPKAMLAQRYGPSLQKETAHEAVEKSLKEIFEKESLKMASQPKVDLKEFKLGSDLDYVADFESLPDIGKIELEKLTIKKPIVEMTEKDLMSIAEDEIKKSPIWEESKSSVKDGCKVKVDFDGTVDGVPFEGGSGKGMDIVIGEGRFLKDFEKGVVGMKPAGEKKIDVTFPNDYHQKTMAGKKAEFLVKIQAIWQAKYHKMDKKWFEICKSEAKTKKEFLEEVRKREQDSVEKMEKKIASNRLSDALKASVSFPVPESLIEIDLEQHGVGEKDKKKETKEAKERVKYMLIMQNLIDEFKIQVTGQEIEKYLESVMPAGIDVNFFKSWYVQDEKRVEKIKMAVLEEKVLERAKGMCQLKDEKMTFAKAKEALNKEV